MSNPTIYSHERLPDWWWLNPWKHAGLLHKATVALANLTARQDDELRRLKQDNRTLALSARHKLNRIAVLESQVREYREARNEDK
jgi:hypothetical protein